MCGLVGVFGKSLFARHHDYLTQGIEVGVVRGRDSTGVFFLGGKGHQMLFKEAIHGGEMAAQLKFLNTKSDFVSTGFGAMAHNRAATSGLVTDDNAHPFQHGGITLAHNGTLLHYTNLPGYYSYSVDSEAITHSVAEIGIKATVALLDGAFALSFWDQESRTMNFIRNHERKLFYAKEKSFDTYLWASEEGMLEWLCHRNKIMIEKPILLPEAQLLTFQINSTTVANGTYKALSMTVKKETLKLKKSKTPIYLGSGQTKKWMLGGTNKSTSPAGAVANSSGSSSVFHNGQSLVVKCGKWNQYLRSASGKGYFECTYGIHTVEVHAKSPDEMEEGALYSVNVVTVCPPLGGLPEQVFCSINRKMKGKAKVVEEKVEEDKQLVLIDQEAQNLVEMVKEDSLKDAPWFKIGSPTELMVWEGYKRSYVRAKEWNKATRFGCMWCGGNLSIDDAKDIGWFARDTPVCPDCIEAVEETHNVSTL